MTLCTDWDYGFSRRPEQWSKDKTRQSPIDIDTANLQEGEDRRLTFDYREADVKLLLKSPKLELKPMTEGAWGAVSVDGKNWTLDSVHAHAPGEHSVNGDLYPGEVHFVHKPQGDESKEPPLLVVGAFLAYQEDSLVLPFEKYLKNGAGYKYKSGELELHPGHPFDPYQILPKKPSAYYAYKGSLTTPPCDERVEFLLLKNPVLVTPDSLRGFDEWFPGGTNRPIQPRFQRPVFLHK